MRHIYVTVYGLVQGVGFRYYTYTVAGQLRIRGWVMNQSDGTVVIEAEGEAVSIEDFIQRIEQGPRHSNVTRIVVEELPESNGLGVFMIR